MKKKNKEVLKKAVKELSKKSKVYLELDAPGTVDVVSDGRDFYYLTTDGEFEKTITVDGKSYTPPQELPYFLANKELVEKYIKNLDDNVLFEELLAYHKSISDIFDDVLYILLTLWDFHTYIADKQHFSPILYLYAVKERGKSRTGKGCIYVARRGLWMESVREPDLLRYGNDHKASLGFDTKDFPKKIERAGCDDLILSRFERGAVASRTLYPKRGKFKDTQYYTLFGPTIVATNRPVDDILESRSVSINMKPSFKVFNKPVVPEDAMELKAKLTAFRFNHFNDELIKADRPTTGRLGDILSPLQEIILTWFPAYGAPFNKLVQTIAISKKEDAADAFEAQVVEALLRSEDMVTKGFISVDTVTSLFNEGRNEKFSIDVRTIGRILRGLGLSSRTSPDGNKRGIYYDPELIKRIAYQYGILDIPGTTSETSETATLEPKEWSTDGKTHREEEEEV